MREQIKVSLMESAAEAECQRPNANETVEPDAAAAALNLILAELKNNGKILRKNNIHLIYLSLILYIIFVFCNRQPRIGIKKTNKIVKINYRSENCSNQSG